jgi:hypothetical protein
MELVRNNIEAFESEFFRKFGIADLATTGMGSCNWTLGFVFLQ